MPAGSFLAHSYVIPGFLQLYNWYEKVFRPFSGDSRELFDIGLKYLNKLIEITWRTKIFESKIFVIHKVLPKFTKILSHEYLEPYGRSRLDLSYTEGINANLNDMAFYTASELPKHFSIKLHITIVVQSKIVTLI